MLVQRMLEELVLLVHNGRNTYKEIKKALPELTDDDLRIASLPMRIVKLSDRVLCLDHHPPGDLYYYRFVDEDKFSLSTYGEDLLHTLLKFQRQEKLAADALREAIEARRIAEESLIVEKAALAETHSSKCYAMIAAIAAVVSVLIALYQLR